MDDKAIKEAVREYYAGRVRAQACCGSATESSGCCTPTSEASGCCATAVGAEGMDVGEAIPSYGCGEPLDASLFHVGEVVVDLGSGPGRDALLVARAVGPAGRVIGVDMTPEMVEAATAAAVRGAVRNAEFRLGDLEALPLAGESADVVISNCVLNLVPDKGKALGEAFRVLRPGGRLIVNDILTKTVLPEAAHNLQAWAACVSGAIAADDYRRMLADTGFVDVVIIPNGEGAGVYSTYSARVTARRP